MIRPDRCHAARPQLTVSCGERHELPGLLGIDETVAQVQATLMADQGGGLFGLQDHLELTPDAGFDIEQVRVPERVEHEQGYTSSTIAMRGYRQRSFREVGVSGFPFPAGNRKLETGSCEGDSLPAVQPIHVNIDKEWLSVADICEYMGVSAFVVTNVLRTGELPGVKFGREWRVARQDFQDWINAQRAARRRS